MEILYNQPVLLNPEEDCRDCDTRCFCQQYGPDDTLYWQGLQTPCDDVLCAGDVNAVVNGGFTANADGWELVTATWNSGGYLDIPDLGETPSVIGQALPFAEGQYICCTFDVTFCEEPGVCSVSFGGSAIDIITTSGTFTVCGLWGGSNNLLGFTFDGGNCATLDNVFVGEPCWEFDESWAMEDDDATTLCHTPGTATSLVNVGTGITQNAYYKVIVTVSDSSAGSIDVSLYSSPMTITGNGTTTVWITAGASGNAFEIIPTSDFDGCVKIEHVYLLKNDIEAALFDSETDAFVAVVTPYIDYYLDWITIAEPWSSLVGGSYGCYKLKFFNTCCNAETILQDGSFEFDPWSQPDDSPWTLILNPENATAGIGADGFFFEPTCEGGSQSATISQVITLCPNTRYTIEFTYTNVDMPSEIINVHIGSLLYIYAIVANTSGSQSETFTTGDETEITVSILLSGNNCGGEITINDIEISQASIDFTLDTPTHTSNCLCFKEELGGCERLVQGYSDNTAFGFEFINTGFRLSQRLTYALDKSSFNDEGSDYIFSNGVRSSSFSQIEKFQTLFIEQVDDITHASIAVTRRCDHFLLGNSSDVMTEYVAKKGDYQPEWVKDSFLKLAPSRFDVSKKGNIVTRTNCK